MSQFPVDFSKANLPRLIADALAGDEVIIAYGNAPMARLVQIMPVMPQGRRCFGTLKGKIGFNESFNEPLPQDEQAGWHLT